MRNSPQAVFLFSQILKGILCFSENFRVCVKLIYGNYYIEDKLK